MIDRHENSSIRFAICVETDDPDLLTPRMIYMVLPDENAEKSSYLRIVDNEGEDYLYPARYFVLVDFPQPVREVLLNTKAPIERLANAESGG